jgi:metal-responsive CopG/Arc/MetJ family transcriptional regulator
MRIALDLDDDLVRQLDGVLGTRGRNDFIVATIRQAVDRADRRRRWAAIERAAGSISDQGHEWDEDVAAWVHDSRRADPKRVG